MTTDWKLEKHLCRCCHSEGFFRNLAEPCVDLGHKKILVDMLRDCLDINLAPVPGLLCAITYTICEACVVRLSDAFTFKTQVLECEKIFQDMYSRDIIKASMVTGGVAVKQPKRQQLGDTSSEVKVKVETPDACPIDLGLSSGDEGNDDGFDDACGVNSDEDEDSDTLETVKKKISRSVKSKEPNKKAAKSKVEEENKEAKVTAKKRAWPAAPRFQLSDHDYTRNGKAYKCTKCNRIYSQMHSLKDHIKTRHYKLPRFTCPYCGKEFLTSVPFTIHKLEDHNIDDRSKCNACNVFFNTEVQLRNHIQIFHMLGEKLKCDSCDYESYSLKGLNRHKFKHKTVKDYHCRFCKKSFLRRNTLRQHEKIHTEDKRKVCTVCKQAFVQKASLNYHMTKYHPEVNF